MLLSSCAIECNVVSSSHSYAYVDVAITPLRASRATGGYEEQCAEEQAPAGGGKAGGGGGGGGVTRAGGMSEEHKTGLKKVVLCCIYSIVSRFPPCNCNFFPGLFFLYCLFCFSIHCGCGFW